MAQIFHRSANVIARASIVGGILLLGLLTWAGAEIYYSSYVSGVGLAQEQVVPFSHKHHVSGLGIDCRYCHESVEVSAFAGIPPTQTCMTCHSQIWSDAPMLEPVRTSFRNKEPLRWNRVHDLPDFVYFNHSIHLTKGIGCTTCHGKVDQMPLMWKENTLYMEWCMECHRNPAKYVRPREYVFSVDYSPPDNQLELGNKLVEEYNIEKLVSCSVCHR
ncbi:MAG: cytochrome c3 family protein [Acidobacteriota bacterium]